MKRPNRPAAIRKNSILRFAQFPTAQVLKHRRHQSCSGVAILPKSSLAIKSIRRFQPQRRDVRE